MSSNWRVVVRYTNQLDGHRIVVGSGLDRQSASRVAKLFCGSGFTLNRRPDIHTFTDKVCVVVERDNG